MAVGILPLRRRQPNAKWSCKAFGGLKCLVRNKHGDAVSSPLGGGKLISQFVVAECLAVFILSLCCGCLILPLENFF